MKPILIFFLSIGLALCDGTGVTRAAIAMIGKYPYSWGGGNENGPTKGIN